MHYGDRYMQNGAGYPTDIGCMPGFYRRQLKGYELPPQ